MRSAPAPVKCAKYCTEDRTDDAEDGTNNTSNDAQYPSKNPHN